jgi:hypothetical protein
VHQSWLFFGMFGSRAEALGLWAAYAPNIRRGDYLLTLALRDFGPTAALKVLESWRHTSEAMGRLPFIQCPNYYIGPVYLGPCHPLAERRDAPMPPVFDGYLFYLQEFEETFSVKQIGETKTCMVMKELGNVSYFIKPDEGRDPWEVAVADYARAKEHMHAAWTLLREAAPLAVTDADRLHLREESLLTELIYRNFRACENTIRFLQARDRHASTGDTAAKDAMRRIALDERENADGARHIFTDAPWLDLSKRTDGYFSPCSEMLATKIEMLDRFLA